MKRGKDEESGVELLRLTQQRLDKEDRPCCGSFVGFTLAALATVLFAVFTIPVAAVFALLDPFNCMHWAVFARRRCRECDTLAGGIMIATGYLIEKIFMWLVFAGIPGVFSWCIILFFPWRIPRTCSLLMDRDIVSWWSSDVAMPSGVVLAQFASGFLDLFVIFCALPGLIVSIHRLKSLHRRTRGMHCGDCLTTKWHQAVLMEYKDCCAPWSHSSYDAEQPPVPIVIVE
ncbi:hypothetical protein Pelo_9511 [Pelomyxa schiedti]|nr:hypothetical protein Pelo_9511 [Pelomyxa schiedti]